MQGDNRHAPSQDLILTTAITTTMTMVTMMAIRDHYLLLKQDLQYVYSILMPADLMLQGTIIGFEQLCSCQQI